MPLALSLFRHLGQQFVSLLDKLEQLTNKMGADSGLQIKNKRFGNGLIEIIFGNYCMAVGWRRHFINILDGAYIVAELFRGLPPRPGRINFDEVPRLKTQKISFDLDESGTHCWRDGEDGRLMDFEQLADHIARILLARVEADV